MAIIDLGSFKVRRGRLSMFSPIFSNVFINLHYDTIRSRFFWEQTAETDEGDPITDPKTFDSIGIGGNRGYQTGEFILSQCSGTTSLSFYALTIAPWATVNARPNRTECSFVAPVPPPTTLPPAPVCDLEISKVETQAISALNAKDGTITVTLSTSVDGEYTINILKSGTNNVVQNIVVDNLNLEYTFNNLPEGLYDIKANSNQYDCVTTENEVQVGGYYFNEIYHFLFCEKRFDKREIRISIKKRGYNGGSYLIENGSNQIAVISYPEKGSDMKFKPIIGSECEIGLIADEIKDLSDIYTDQEKEYLLELSFVDTEELIWSGYILPEQAEEPFKFAPYVVNLIATDGIKTLEDISFNLDQGRITFLEGIKFCLDKTDHKLGFKTSIDIYNIDADKFVLLSGLETNIYGNSVVVTPGTYNFDGVEKTISSPVTLTLPSLGLLLPIWRGYMLINASGNIIFSQTITKNTVVLATVRILRGSIPEVTRLSNYTPDTLANHTFDVKRFIKEDGGYTDCYTVLEYICKQFTAQLKQSGGFWVIENIGNKARNEIILESCYDNDLNPIYINEPINLLSELDCDSDNVVISGANLTTGAAYKESIVSWKLGYPQPVIRNYNFESWVSSGSRNIPTDWEMTTPEFGNRGNKVDRTYDPTTGEITSVANGSYYFSAFSFDDDPRDYDRELKSSSNIAVFQEEVINFSFQFIGNAVPFLYCYFIFEIGGLFCTNLSASGSPIDPVWQPVKRPFMIEISEQLDANGEANTFGPFGESSNINFSLPKSPAKGYFNFSIFKPASTARPQGGPQRLGFDNFKITKSSPISGATVKENIEIKVENRKRFTTKPDVFEVFFGDIDNEFRTDGIKDLSNNATLSWRRSDETIANSSGINTIVAREILSQYQNTFRILSGSVIAKDISIRSMFNLPTFELYRFATLSGSYNLIECSADIVIAEVYAEEGENSGPIGGGNGLPQQGNPNPEQFVLGFKNNIFTDNNDNIFLANGN